MTVFVCEICSREFASKQAFGGHKSAAHKNGPRYSHKRKLTQKCDAYQCQFCGKETTNAGANKEHENKCLNNTTPSKVIREKKSEHKGANQYTKAKKLGLPKPVISDATRKKLSEANLGRKHKQETKDKISKIRRKYLSENPDMVPYKLNHYSKGRSYPERYWKDIFDEAGIDYVEQHQIHTYQLDFALVEEKIDIEIDGDQHYLDQRIVESDKRRDEYLENLGWKIIRVRWSEYKKLIDKQDRMDYVTNIINEIRTGTQVDKGN
jgi:very-short-patch-repair endonuclease